MKFREFFREHDVFQHKERDETTLLRLDARYHAIIEGNRDAIEGKRVLDLACHDGRWSYAALDAGAAHVLGIEGRQNLVDKADRTFADFGAPPARYEFRVGDAHEATAAFEPGTFDTILCLGFLYHTPQHVRLFEEFRRLRAQDLVLDTGINRSQDLVVEFVTEDTSDRLMAIGDRPLAWAGTMSRPLMEALVREAGYDFRYFDWAAFCAELGRPCPGITESHYADGRRVTMRAMLRG